MEERTGWKLEAVGLRDDDTRRLADLRRLTTQIQRERVRSEEQFSELYHEEPLHLFTTAPLAESRNTKKLRAPRHLVIIGAVLLSLVGMASPFALAGFNKTSAVPMAIVEVEPFKTRSEPTHMSLPSRRDEQTHEILFDNDDVVVATREGEIERRSFERPRRARQVIPSLHTEETGAVAPRTEADDQLGGVIDDVLGDRSPLEPSPPSLPQSPTRAQVLTSLRSVSEAVARCGDDQGGRVTVDVTINGPTGRVSNVRITNGAEGTTAACVSRAVRRAQFPPFADDDFRVSSFPYTVR